MSNLVVNKLSEFLSKVIKNYTKEHLNVSLLKGEIFLKDFEVDVNVINVYVEFYVPFLYITKASVSDVKLSLPDVFHLSAKPTLIQIGSVSIECQQRDFSKPSARELLGDDDFLLTSSSKDDDNDNYGLIKKVIDGCRVVIDRVHAKMSLDGLPSADDQSGGPSFGSNWFGKIDPANFSGPPLILDVLLQNVEFAQCNGSWQHSGDLKLLRKQQGDRSKDFCVYKTLSAESFDVTLMPHPRRLKAASRRHQKRKSSKKSGGKKKKSKRKKKYKSINIFPVLLLQNAPLDLKFIFQRKANDGTIKSISIECFWGKLNVFMTQNQYFDLNYWIASLLYAQAQQYAFENPHLIKDRNSENDEPSKSYTHSMTATATSVSAKSKDGKDGGKESKEDDEGAAAAQETKHLSSGKQLFDALSLCQPPRFQWNKLPLYTTVGFRVDRVTVHIMPDDWNGRIPRRESRRNSKLSTPQPTPQHSMDRLSNASSKTADVLKGVGKGMGNVSKSAAKGIGKGVGTMAKGVGTLGKGIGKGIGKGVKSAITGGKGIGSSKERKGPSNSLNAVSNTMMMTNKPAPPHGPPPSVPPLPPPTKPSKLFPGSTGSNRLSTKSLPSDPRRSHSADQSPSNSMNGNSRSKEYNPGSRSLSEEYSEYLRRQPKMVESRLSDRDRDFLISCTLLPTEAINKISVGLELDYVPNLGHSDSPPSSSSPSGSTTNYCKPLVIAVMSHFSLGMIFPDLGYSIWRTKIGKMRAEQFFSVQVGDIDVLADTQLKDQLQSQMQQTFDAALSQLRKEQELIEAESGKAFTPEPSPKNTNKQNEKTKSSNPTPSGDTLKTPDDDTIPSPKNATHTRSQSDPLKSSSSTTTESGSSTKGMTLLISSRHFKTQTITHSPYKFTVQTPFQGYNADTQTVFNYQWTRRIPAPERVLAQISDCHLKPLVIWLDPFLVFNCAKIFAGNGVVKVYQMQAALSTFTVVFERFASRYLLDALKIIIPVAVGSRVSVSIHNLRLSSHDKLDQTVHERGLVDLSNFSSVGKHSLLAMGLGSRIVDDIQRTKREYFEEVKRETANAGHFSSSYDNRLKASMAPGVSAILRPPDEYPWEINIGHLSLASVVELEDERYDNEIQILNCRMRYVLIRSDSGMDDIDEHDMECEREPRRFVETQLSFRTDSVEGSIDTTVIDQVMSKVDFGGIADLPLPALFNKIKLKMQEKEERKEMERQMKRQRMENPKAAKAAEDKKMRKRLRRQQKRREELLKNKRLTLDDTLIANDVLLSGTTDHVKHQDVRDIELSESDNDDDDDDGDGKLTKLRSANSSGSASSGDSEEDKGDLDTFIEGVLDVIGNGKKKEKEETDDDDDDEGDDGDNDAESTLSPQTPKTTQYGNLVVSDNSDSESNSTKKRKVERESNIEYRVIVFSNLDRGEFLMTNNGKTKIRGKTRSQQLLLQWTEDIVNFHFFSSELKLYESPIGRYQEHDVVTRFSRAKDGRMWSEVVHDEPDGAIEMTYPPSLQRVADKVQDHKLNASSRSKSHHTLSLQLRNGNVASKADGDSNENDDALHRLEVMKKEKAELMDLIRYITLENRVMQTRVLQLASDLSVSREDMRRFVKQMSEDKIRIVEHQQYLITDNMELQKQVQSFKKRVRELELKMKK